MFSWTLTHISPRAGVCSICNYCRQRRQKWNKLLGPERLARLDSFFGRIAELVGNVLTEDQARAIWRETAEPTSETLH
jgi:hypothetical protein